MPAWKVHEFVDKIVLGKKYKKVHRLLDFPAFFVKNHRRFFHDKYGVLLALITHDFDVRAGLSALLHIKTDKKISYKEGKILLNILRLLRIT